MNKISHKT